MKKNYLLFVLLFIFSCTEKQPFQKHENVFYDKAFEFLEKGNNVEAFVNFNKAKDVFIKQKNSLGAGKCLSNMAILQEQIGDYYGSQETGLTAISFYNELDAKHYDYIATNYNTLGVTSSKLKNYPKAIEFYQKSLNFITDSTNKNISRNNLSESFKKEKKYDSAIKILNNIILNSPKKDIDYARVLTNLGSTKWLQSPNYNPIPEYHEALKIRLKEKDNWGLNSSYAHLTNYYTSIKPDSALIYARKMYYVSKLINSPDDQIEALHKLISLEGAAHSKNYFKIYQNISDSLQTARNKSKNQFALIRYETEKNKADFLNAKAENAEKQNHIIIQYFGIGILAFLVVFGYSWLKKGKIIAVKNTELKYSKKVHDKVANKIYQVMSQVENSKHIDKNELLFSLENAYEISRDISYDTDINENQNFVDQLSMMLNSYSSDFIKTICTGNTENVWEGVNFQCKTEIYLILQELMTNMKKHSNANIVSLKFSRLKHEIIINYTDNGIGIQELSPKNGIQNMENRIRGIDGKITFDTDTNRFLKINISFPVKK